jgi:hypothetical protein
VQFDVDIKFAIFAVEVFCKMGQQIVVGAIDRNCFGGACDYFDLFEELWAESED